MRRGQGWGTGQESWVTCSGLFLKQTLTRNHSVLLAAFPSDGPDGQFPNSEGFPYSQGRLALLFLWAGVGGSPDYAQEASF